MLQQLHKILKKKKIVFSTNCLKFIKDKTEKFKKQLLKS